MSSTVSRSFWTPNQYLSVCLKSLMGMLFILFFITDGNALSLSLSAFPLFFKILSSRSHIEDLKLRICHISDSILILLLIICVQLYPQLRFGFFFILSFFSSLLTTGWNSSSCWSPAAVYWNHAYSVNSRSPHGLELYWRDDKFIVAETQVSIKAEGNSWTISNS